MSGFKDKAAYFENIFSNLDKDSDDEDQSADQARKEESPVATCPPKPPCDGCFIDISSSPDTQEDISSSPEDQIVLSSSPELDRVDTPPPPPPLSAQDYETYITSSPEAEDERDPGQDYVCLDSDSNVHNFSCPIDDSVGQSSDTNDPITLKFQDGNRKHMREFQVEVNEPLLKPKEEYAKEFNIDITTMKLYFDGDLISDQDTAARLDIEDGCVIDVVLPQTISYVAPPSPVDLVSPTKPSPRGRGTPRGRARRGVARGRVPRGRGRPRTNK